MDLSWFEEMEHLSANENTPALSDHTSSLMAEAHICDTVLSIKHQLESWQQYMKKNFESEPV